MVSAAAVIAVVPRKSLRVSPAICSSQFDGVGLVSDAVLVNFSKGPHGGPPLSREAFLFHTKRPNGKPKWQREADAGRSVPNPFHIVDLGPGNEGQ
jgi:hypothetical protein